MSFAGSTPLGHLSTQAKQVRHLYIDFEFSSGSMSYRSGVPLK